MFLNVIFCCGFIILNSTESKNRWEEAGMTQKHIGADNSHIAAF